MKAICSVLRGLQLVVLVMFGPMDWPLSSVAVVWLFIRPFEKRDVLCRCNVRPSVCPSVRPFVRQFAADDILLYKICYNIQWIYFTIWEKGKEELSPLQYHFKSLHIISRHYKKSLLRSQIYHGYEELSTDTNYPIWRRQKLPYMKKTRKKKQVCGAACFMAVEIKFSEDVRPSVRVFRTFLQHALRYQFETWYIHSVGATTCRVWVASQLGHFDLVYSQK